MAAPPPSVTSILWDWNSPPVGRATRKRAHPSGEENEGTLWCALEGEAGKCRTRFVPRSQKLESWMWRAREMDGARDNSGWHTREKERERAANEKEARQLICTCIWHPRGSSVQLLTLMYNVPLSISFPTSIPPLRRSYLDVRSSRNPRIRAWVRGICYQAAKLLGQKNVIRGTREIMSRLLETHRSEMSTRGGVP